jgi:hypothetical protein
MPGELELNDRFTPEAALTELVGTSELHRMVGLNGLQRV